MSYNFRQTKARKTSQNRKISLEVMEKTKRKQQRKNQKKRKNTRSKTRKKKGKPAKNLEPIPEEMEEDDMLSEKEDEKDTTVFDDALDDIGEVDIKKYKKKTKQQQRKHFQKFYDRRFFQILRKQTIRRFLQGFRVRYTTLDKYKLKKEYLSFLEKQIALGKSEYESYVTLFNDEMIYENRLQNKVVPYENETEQRVVNAMRATGVGANINPAKIVMMLDPKNTQGAKEKYVNVNPSQRDNFIVQQPDDADDGLDDFGFDDEQEMMAQDDEPEPNPDTPGVVDDPRKSWEDTRKDVYVNDFNLPYQKYDINKGVFTFADAVAWFKSREYLIMNKSGNEVTYSVPADVRKKKEPENIGSLRTLMDILGCIGNDPRYWKVFPAGTRKVYLRNANKARQFVIRNNKRVFEAPEDKPLDKMIYKKSVPQPLGNENLIDCFKGNREEIRQKAILMTITPSRKTGKPPANFNKQKFSAINALARSVIGRMKNPFAVLLQKKTLGLKLWTDEFTNTMTKFRNKEEKGMSEGVKKSVAWKYIMNMLKEIRRDWLKEKKVQTTDKTSILRRAQVHMDYLTILLYCLKPSTRDDYAICRVVEGSPDVYLGKYEAFTTEEGIVITGSPLVKKNGKLFNYYFPEEETFVFQRFKTQKDYKQRRHFLKVMEKTAIDRKIPLGFGTLLAREIALSLKEYPRKWLIAKPNYTQKDKLQFKQIAQLSKKILKPKDEINTSKLSKRIALITRKYIPAEKKVSGAYGVNMLRHATVSFLWRQVGIDLTSKQILANYMLHTKEEAEKTYNWALRKEDVLKDWRKAFKGVINLEKRTWVKTLS